MQDIKLKTGTTTVGLVCKDAVIVASESKSTMGSLIASKESQKVYQVDDKIALTTAGGAGDAQAVVRLLKAEINIYRMTRNAKITVKATITLLANILNSHRYYPYLAMLIVGGHDKDGFHIYSIDPVGGAEKDDFTATGSGSPMAYGVLEDGYSKNINREDGIRLAVRSIRSARERDVFSGGKNIVVAVIDEKGLTYVDKKIIDEIAK